jgi:hypothetical protein
MEVDHETNDDIFIFDCYYPLWVHDKRCIGRKNENRFFVAGGNEFQ